METIIFVGKAFDFRKRRRKRVLKIEFTKTIITINIAKNKIRSSTVFEDIFHTKTCNFYDNQPIKNPHKNEGNIKVIHKFKNRHFEQKFEIVSQFF